MRTSACVSNDATNNQTRSVEQCPREVTTIASLVVWKYRKKLQKARLNDKLVPHRNFVQYL
jgi:hypothetical protein